MRNDVQLCLAANNITLLREKINGRSLRFPEIFIKKQTWWSNEKTIFEFGYRKILCQRLADQLFASSFGFGK